MSNKRQNTRCRRAMTFVKLKPKTKPQPQPKAKLKSTRTTTTTTTIKQLQHSLHSNRCDVVVLVLLVILATMTSTFVACAKLETQIKLLINDDELLLQPSKHTAQQHEHEQQQQHNAAAAGKPEHYNLYRSELKRLSYETIHRILRDEHEPVQRRDDAEFRYYQKRSPSASINRHQVVRRSISNSTTTTISTTTTPTPASITTTTKSPNTLRFYRLMRRNLTCFEVRNKVKFVNDLNLSMNKFKTFNLSEFSQLRVMDLSHNSFDALPSLERESALVSLNLNGNQIKQGVAPPNYSLRELHLSANGIESLTALNLSQLNALEILDLSCNHLQTLETSFFPQRMHNLKQLNLAHNNLSSIYRETFYNLLSLNTLLLTDNNITDIDYETFLALPNLQYLDLSYNELKGESIRALQGIPDLMALSIAYNTEVGASMQEFVASWSLKELDASGTGLCQIPAALAQSVRSLKLTDNWLKIINCGDLDSYPLLQYLDLSYSRIEDIEDDALGRLEILEILFLDHNYLRKIPTSLPTSLEHLFLQYNEIMDIQVQSFQGLSNLQTLDLSGNKLLYLPALMLPKLLTLNLQSSGLKGLSQAIVHTLPRLRDLMLEDNPIKCTDLLGIAEWAKPCRVTEQHPQTIIDENYKFNPEYNNNNDDYNRNIDDNNSNNNEENDYDDYDYGVVNYDLGQRRKRKSSKTKIDLKQKFVQMHSFFEKFKSGCGREKRNSTKLQEMPTCAVEHDVIDETTTRTSGSVEETRTKTVEDEIVSEVDKLFERNAITTTTITAPTTNEHNFNQTEFSNAPLTTTTTTPSEATKKPTREIVLRQQQPTKTATNSSSQNSTQQEQRAEATNGIKINEIPTTTAATAATTKTESTANSNDANQVERVTKHEQLNTTNTEATTTETTREMETADVATMKSPNAKQETLRKTLRQAKLQLNVTTTTTPVTTKTITTSINASNVEAITTTVSHLPSMSSLNNNEVETLSLTANITKTTEATTKQISKEITNDRISMMPQTMLTEMLLNANGSIFKNNNNKRHSNIVRANPKEDDDNGEYDHIPIAEDNKSNANIENNNEVKLMHKTIDNNKTDNDNTNNNDNHIIEDKVANDKHVSDTNSTIDNNKKFIDIDKKNIDNSTKNINKHNSANNQSSQKLKILPEITTTSALSPQTAANDVHVQKKMKKNVAAAMTTTITTSSTPTMTTINLATTTNGQLPTIATTTISRTSKSAPHQQQQQQHREYQMPTHKHEPLQLHIREQDRHLIGTPVLMHRGQNMLVENEQLLLLPPNPTTNTKTTTTATRQTGMTTTSAKMPAMHKVNVNEHNGNGNVNDSLSSSRINSNIVSNNKTGNQADILASSQYNSSNNNTNHTDKLKEQSVAKMTSMSTVTGPTSQNYATMATILTTTTTMTTYSRYAKKHVEKKQPSLTMKQMTITTKHTHTPQKSAHHYALNAPRENEALDLHYYKELKPIAPSSAEIPSTTSHAKASHKHSTVNTPIYGHQHSLNTFSAQQQQHHEAQQQQHHEALMVKERVTKSEQWRLDLRKATATGHPGLVILLSFSLFVVLLVGLMHVYRCDMPWRRHLRATHQRPHQRHFNDDDAHSFLHYQQQQQQQQQNTPSGVIQKWHHSTRRHAPYSSPLHNLQVRELQKTSAVEQQQQQQQQAQRIKQAYYSAASNNAYNGIRSNSDSSDSSQTSSRSGSSTQSHCSASAAAAAAAGMMGDEAYYIESATEAAQPANNSLHSDLLPMELLNVSSANRGSSDQTDAFSELLDKSENNGSVVGVGVGVATRKTTNTRKLGLSLW